jgi:uncharacterized protein YjiS (DUF1127 family)
MTHVSALIPAPARPVDSPRQLYGLAALQGLFATYRARRRFRCDLERMAKENPHLIADIGLTRWQAEAEVAKRFWRA